MKVLVTDGHLKSALAAVRSLGRRGYEVHSAQCRPGPNLCSLSAYTRKSHVLPPYREESDFAHAFLELVSREKFDYVIVCSDDSVVSLSPLRDEILRWTRIDLPPPAAIGLVMSRARLMKHARTLDIPVPETLDCSEISEGTDLRSIVDKLGFPLVFKTPASETYDRVRYINDFAALTSTITRHREQDYLLQQYVRGKGRGLFALFENGSPVLWHMHERIWEYPITGGPSVLARIIDDPVLEKLGLALLRSLKWNGVAMVEFKYSPEAGYFLMEINPRLWGSLDLSIAAGADFPYLLVEPNRRAVAGKMRVRPTSCLWLLPESVLFLSAMPSSALDLFRLLLSPSVKKNLCLDDLRPAIRQVREALYWLGALYREGRLLHPHGWARLHSNKLPGAQPLAADTAAAEVVCRDV